MISNLRIHYFFPPVQRSTEVPENGVIGFVNNFYEANRELIDGVGIGIASLTGDGKALEQTIGSFAESAKAMIQGLDALASIHPAVGGAHSGSASKTMDSIMCATSGRCRFQARCDA